MQKLRFVLIGVLIKQNEYTLVNVCPVQNRSILAADIVLIIYFVRGVIKKEK